VYSRFYGQWQGRAIIHQKRSRLRKNKINIFIIYNVQLRDGGNNERTICEIFPKKWKKWWISV